MLLLSCDTVMQECSRHNIVHANCHFALSKGRLVALLVNLVVVILLAFLVDCLCKELEVGDILALVKVEHLAQDDVEGRNVVAVATRVTELGLLVKPTSRCLKSNRYGHLSNEGSTNNDVTQMKCQQNTNISLKTSIGSQKFDRL